MTLDGGKLPPPADMFLSFEGDTIRQESRAGKIPFGDFQLNTASDPRHIDLTFPPSEKSGPETRTVHGLYRLDGATLTLSYPIGSGTSRPKTLGTGPGFTLELRRVLTP